MSIRHEPWKKDAACVGNPPEWWDVGDKGNEVAKKICGGCPVNQACYQSALDNHVFGVIQGGEDHCGKTRNPRARMCALAGCRKVFYTRQQASYCSDSCRAKSPARSTANKGRKVA